MKTKPSQAAITSIPELLQYDPRLAETITASGITRPEIRARAKAGKIKVCATDRPKMVVDFEKAIAGYGKTVGQVIATLGARGARYAAKPDLLEMTDDAPAEIWITIDGDGTLHSNKQHVLTFTDTVSIQLGRCVDLLCNL
ncbi:MAG: hypothetical protein WCJ39_10535 [bacterium]